MIPSISYDRSEETPEAKARWFRSLTLEERMDYFVEMMDFILEVNPEVARRKNRDARPMTASFRVIDVDECSMPLPHNKPSGRLE